MGKILNSLFRAPVLPGPEPHSRQFGTDELSKARLHDTLNDFIVQHLGWSDVVSTTPLVWVKTHTGPVHPIFGLTKMKGGVAWPEFGLSVDFVPIVDRKRAVLRPAPKSAKFDILIDGRDRRCEIDFSSGPACAIHDAERGIPQCLEIARNFWQSHSDITSLASAVQFMERHVTADVLP